MGKHLMLVALFGAVVAFPGEGTAQRLVSSGSDQDYALHQFWAGLYSWTTWPADSGLAPTLQIVAHQRHWRDAAASSPSAAYYLASFAALHEPFAQPLAVREAHSYSCGNRLATADAVIDRLDGDIDTEEHLRLMPPLREGEVFRVHLRTQFEDGVPRVMRFVTEWFMLPHPVQQVGELTVHLEPVPLYWVPVHLSTAKAPVMRVASVAGREQPAPGWEQSAIASAAVASH